MQKCIVQQFPKIFEMLKVLWRHTCLSLLDNLSYFLSVRRSFSDFAISRRTARFDMWTLLYCPFFFLRSFLFARHVAVFSSVVRRFVDDYYLEIRCSSFRDCLPLLFYPLSFIIFSLYFDISDDSSEIL